MVSVNPDIFRAYDIRGVFGRDFDANFAEEFGNKIISALDARIVVIGRDSRVSSNEIEKFLLEGVLHAGAHVYEIGICTTPSFYYAVQAKGAGIGIMITASHNPEEYNGFKVIDGQGTIISGTDLGTMYANTDLKREGGGTAEPYGAILEYAEAVARIGGGIGETFPVGVKGPKANQLILTKIGEKSGLLIQEKNSQGLEVVFDDDADRISFFDRKRAIGADFITLLIAQHFGYKRIVHDFRFSRGVRKAFAQLGITAIPSRIGRLALQQNMRSSEADLGAELSGHYYLKEFNGLESPETILLWLRTILQTSGKNLSELIKPYDTWFRTEELSYPLNTNAQSAVAERFADGKVSMEDGVYVEYEDWWFSLRPSNTEPLMRLVVEANSAELLERKLAEITSVIS